MKIIKSIVKVGNSAGVILPREWLNGKARIELIAKPLNIKQDLINILEPYLFSIVSILIVGSWARNEQREDSDVDILVITDNLNKKIKQGKYEIILISQKNLEKQLKTNIIPILPMLKEAKPILNKKLIEKYKNTDLTKKNLKFHIETTKSALSVNKEMINLDKKQKSKCSDSVSYSLVLRLRGVYIVECLIKKKLWNNKEFIRLAKKISGSGEAYEGYLRAKNDKKTRETLRVEEAERLYNYIVKKIKEQEKCVKRKK